MDLTNVPANARAGLIAMNADRALAQIESPTVILSRYESGESIETIANDYGVSPGAVYLWLYRNASEQWQAHIGARAHWRLDQAEARLDTASDGVEVSRARELLRAQQWRMERVMRRVWGQDAPAVQINVNLGEIGSRIRDLEAELLGHAAVLTVESPKE